MLIIKAK